MYGDFDDGQGDFSSPIGARALWQGANILNTAPAGSGRPGEEDEMFESFQLDESGDVDTEPWYLDEEQEEVSFNEIVDEVARKQLTMSDNVLLLFIINTEGGIQRKASSAAILQIITGGPCCPEDQRCHSEAPGVSTAGG